MFRKKLDVDLKAVEDVKNKLSAKIQSLVDEIPENEDLEYVQLDFKAHFNSVIFQLKQIHKLYVTCCKHFNSIYVEYLKKANDHKNKDKFKNFQNVVNQWEWKVQTNFMIGGGINYAKNMIDQFADEKSIFYSTLNEIRETGTFSKTIKTWETSRNQAFGTFVNIISNVPRKECTKHAEEFSKELNTLFL